MSRKTFAKFIVPTICLVVSAVVCAQTGEAPAILTIQVDKPVSKVSPTLYGLMTEEINFSYDGGLYAEMVRNRTFRPNRSNVPNWILVEDGSAQARMSIDQGTGPSEALPHSLRLDVARADESNPAGVLNEGYWGMPLRPNTTYQGSFYAKEDSTVVGPVTIGLIANQSGKVLATTTISGVTTDWKQYTFTLKTAAIEPSAANHLVLTVAHPGALWLSLVSLFPPTYRDRVNGNRIDLMEKLGAMHPAFLRFPGGNYLEGDHIPERYEWKKTIGPLVDRPTHPSPWRYHSSDGLGLLEFLEWCEDLKMQPVLAVYAGYSMAQEHVNPGTDLDPYVQDALDEIEYVVGGTDTKWGAVRAKNGHPEPFQLNYVEIGNEDFFDRSGSYDGRYAQFYKVIKAKYPDLQLIATTPVKSIRPDVVDDHYYRRATEFFNDTTHYDKTDRTGPKIFVGEWATREGSPTPNFGAALGDAAWMTGMERNSDIIVMAAYAPLFVNVNPGGMQWETDLIGYDAMRSYGSPSYYAQVMFADYVGDETLASSLENGGPKLFYSITRDSKDKRLYLKLVNASSKSQTVDIKFSGANLASTGKLVSLEAHDTQATNTIDQPNNIVPVESTLPNVGSTLHHTMPAYSIQVLSLDQR
ncbi:alpha-N-arabinofuranosidase [Alloacidobacterium dinghuense]|uniref:non-reducing end alpha-L-arabinofuranosidase n=1 Tax=Alloacidobacterium dinghuense TaxID=2763107 RepID=A0A7G8BJI5_9BACT|nr:alpha-L-arabinofuranosidase C-terminal domain-containing protein [Alloacidobacterium dinghuense]QNI32705.1 alpha-N-arabinofuranosidase [Alloacidobacterium dinghuense]